MELSFVKLHGAGNDFVVIDDLSDEITLTAQQVAYLCDRHRGIGADGVILVKPSPRSECVAYMHYVNSDGSLAEMCGNGVRCFAKFLVDRGFVGASRGSFIADTLAGPRPITFEVDEDGLMTQATVDMGAPLFNPEAIPTMLQATSEVMHSTTVTGDAVREPVVLDTPVETPYGTFALSCVSMGNPHAVIFLDDLTSDALERFDIAAPGSYLESHTLFPQKINVEFATIERNADDTRIVMRVWERGCGETLACGTGACATAVAAALSGRTGQRVTLALLGGDLQIEWAEDNHVFLTGPATEVFTGTITEPV